MKPIMVTLSSEQRVLDALQTKQCSWDELRAATKLKEEGLGFVIGVLLDARKIWTDEQSGVRMYGIERRLGLAPRFQEHRRASDLHA